MKIGKSTPSSPYPTVDKITYTAPRHLRRTEHESSIEVMGLDTEAHISGQCFMIATSEGDVFRPHEFPSCFFNRKYRGTTFVTYNLKYDMGALIQTLPSIRLQELRENDLTEHEGFKYRVVGYKQFVVSKGKNAITLYDMANFFKTSLDYAAQKFLGVGKLDQDVSLYDEAYVESHWNDIADYCIQDAILVRDLARVLLSKFEAFGVYPQRLYSTAYVSFQYFRSKIDLPLMHRFLNFYPDALNAAMRGYCGGKFEVTAKGPGYFYEYDIVSAYPFEISKLLDIKQVRIIRSRKYQRHAQYGFLDCRLKIPFEVYNPVPVKDGMLNIYPCGEFEKTITLLEYDYLRSLGVKIEILQGWWFHVENEDYLFESEIARLMEYKKQYKRDGKDIEYHIIKIFLNSLYGKFVQLIKTKAGWKAGASWNPIYAAYITAGTRVAITKIQQQYPSTIAVHTDSVISTESLNMPLSKDLGRFNYETEGEGLILGSGIYQIGDTTKFRGFVSKTPLKDIIDRKSARTKIKVRRPLTWREVIFHGWETDRINYFETINKQLRVDFDRKRLWLNDWKTFGDATERVVESLPLYYDPSLGF